LCAGADLSGLLELPQSLDSLWVGGEAFEDAAAPVLARLTQLESLYLSFTPMFTDAGLEQLTELDLGRFCIYISSISEAISPACVGNIDLTSDSEKVRTLTDSQGRSVLVLMRPDVRQGCPAARHHLRT
jgi:hypothetical protein